MDDRKVLGEEEEKEVNGGKGGTRFTLDSLLFSLTSRPLEKLRGPPDSATPGGQ